MSNYSYLEELRRKVGTDLLLVPGVAAVIHNDTGQLLLQEKASGEGWSLPAGAIEPGETPHQAILREVREETGLKVEVQSIAGVFGGKDFRHEYPNGDRVENVVALFLCRCVGRHSGPIDGETKSLQYFSRECMPPLALPYPVAVLFADRPAMEGSTN